MTYTNTPSTAPAIQRWLPTESSVGQARAELRALLDSWDITEVAEPATLVLSELMTNALRNARRHGGDIEIRCEPWGDGGVHLEVLDGDAVHLPRMRPCDTEAENGRGLVLVQALTNGGWGTDLSDGPGKRVWANVPRC